MARQSIEIAPGAIYYPGYLDRGAQEALLVDVRAAIATAPLYHPRMPRSGKSFSVRMTNCGPLGWVSDIDGYRYQATHPETGAPWPGIPRLLTSAWRDLSGVPFPPQACLVNYYAEGTRLGLHQDRDENELAAPVVSLSLGDTAVFRIGGSKRGEATRSVKLASGDAFVFGGPSRLAYHGIDRVLSFTSTLLPEGGRFNLTMRRVTPAK
ncbi:MAG: alpha-ketoglutarate-dependent dioxygenase AlkB [Hyphomicrobiales bacterium]|nr:alpha-ketoglutarate-dependent dioxygenase AlkB [Hyphomicrobiales bacterium]